MFAVEYACVYLADNVCTLNCSRESEERAISYEEFQIVCLGIYEIWSYILALAGIVCTNPSYIIGIIYDSTCYIFPYKFYIDFRTPKLHIHPRKLQDIYTVINMLDNIKSRLDKDVGYSSWGGGFLPIPPPLFNLAG